jgi:hypothetical protein
MKNHPALKLYRRGGRLFQGGPCPVFETSQTSQIRSRIWFDLTVTASYLLDYLIIYSRYRGRVSLISFNINEILIERIRFTLIFQMFDGTYYLLFKTIPLRYIE